MNWIKLDDQFFSHPKVVDLSKDAKLLYLAGLCYCGAQLTDGLLTRGGVRIIGAMVEAGLDKATTELVQAGLWEAVEGGWFVHDYLDYQSSREKAMAVRIVRAEAGARGGRQSGATRQANSEAKSKQNRSKTASKIEADTETDTETEREDAPDDWEAVGHAARRSLALVDDPAVATGERGYRKPRGVALPTDWGLTPDRVTWAATQCPHVVAPAVATAKFTAHHRARGERRSLAEWQAEWEKWMLGDEARALQDAAARGGKAPLAASSGENPHTRDYLRMVEARNARRDAKIAAIHAQRAGVQ